MTNIWILVADGAKASLLGYNTAERRLSDIDGGELEHINKPSRDLVTTERGRVFHSADDSRSAMERPSDPHRYEKAQFAAEISRLLDKRINEFDQLVLVAAPKTLGDLRQKLSAIVRNKVVEEIDKDLAGESATQLATHLHKLIDFKRFHSRIE